MTRALGLALAMAALAMMPRAQAAPASFTWAGVDGLGRALPFTAPRPPRRRQVAMFYWTWHYNFANLPPRVAGEIVRRHPEARNDFAHPAWEKTPSGTSYFWGEPLFGFYTNLDAYVVEKHAVMLADAGVDAVVFDCTNGTFTWMPAVEALLAAFQRLRARGIATPQVAFMLNFAPNANTAAELRQLYRDLYAPGRYADLWFRWNGKPLVMAHPGALDRKDGTDRRILEFFTFRRNEPTYFCKDRTLKSGFWGWCSVHPQTRFGVHRGKDGREAVEQMTVSVAQNATRRGLAAMNDARDPVFGRGYARGAYQARFPMRDGAEARVSSSSPEAWLWGVNFQQQWDYAIQADPELVFVTGWNEWIAGRHSEWCGTPNAFPDEFSPEFSRDLEPSRHAPYDHFYCQLVANIRRWKGGAQPPPPVPLWQGADPMDFAAWRAVKPEFTDPEGDIPARDADGWRGCHYRQEAAPNDIVLAKAAFDGGNLYFYLRTAAPMQPAADGRAMRLLLDCGGPGGWEGFQYLVCRRPDGRMELRRFGGGGFGGQRAVAVVPHRQQGRELVVAVPRAALKGWSGAALQFKWSDAQRLEADGPLAFYTGGDAAPNARFRYVMRGIR